MRLVTPDAGGWRNCYVTALLESWRNACSRVNVRSGWCLSAFCNSFSVRSGQYVVLAGKLLSCTAVLYFSAAAEVAAS